MTEEEKQEQAQMKKYYRNRYATFLKAIGEEKAKKEKEQEEIKQREEKFKMKIKDKGGFNNI